MDLLEMRVLLAFCALFVVLAAAPARAQSPFQASGNTVSLAVTGITGRVAVAVDAYNSAIRVYNAGTVPVFIACGDVTVTAVLATSVPVAPGSVEVLGCGKGYIAGISAGTAATLYLTPGAGI
jgi:hypothetical protein